MPTPLERLEDKRQRVKPHLVRSGCVCRRRLRSGTTVWALRYRERADGGCRQRSIYVGSEVYAEKAPALIRRWRAEAHPPGVGWANPSAALVEPMLIAYLPSRQPVRQLPIHSIEY
ncbi:MAG: hypothetical protein V2A79_10825 [Planctomycetota bacterium]